MAVRLSALDAGHPLPQEDSWYSFLLEVESIPPTTLPRAPQLIIFNYYYKEREFMTGYKLTSIVKVS
jgi:hypothetical protein